jgi:hypothetical protein
MTVGILLTTRRQNLADAAWEAASRQGLVVAATHGFARPWAQEHPADAAYTDILNATLARAEAAGLDAVAKWDDHDEYPAGHAATLARRYAGRPALGRARVRDCATGRIVGTTTTLAAGILPTTWRAEPAPSGRIANQPPTAIPTGAVKTRCGDWSWADPNPWHCPHRPLG